jgi:hypothetical protein
VETVLWSSNPSKACDHDPEQPHETCWYAQETWGMPRSDIASQLDCSYDASIAGQIWPRLSRTTHLVEDDIRWARLLADYPGRWLVGLDVGVGPSATAAVLCRWSPTRSALLIDWACEWWQATAHDVGLELGAELMRRKIQCPILVDPSAWARDPTQRSWAAHAEDGLRQSGYRMGSFSRAGAQSDRSTIDAIDLLTRGRSTHGAGLLRFGPRAERAFSRAVAYRWRQGPGVTQEVRDGLIVGISGHSGDPSPRKDEASHLSDALQNVAQATLLHESLPQRYVGRM